MDVLVEEISFACKCKTQTEIQRKHGRIAAKRDRDLMLERQAALEKEIWDKFPIPVKVKVSAKEE